MRKRLTQVAAAVTWVVWVVVLWMTLLQVNMPVICGRGPARWWYWLETILFAPTYWVTAPLDKAFSLHGHAQGTTLVSVVETMFLATLYSFLVLRLVRRDLRARVLVLWHRRRGVLAALAITFGLVSLGARLENWRLDFRRELHAGPATPRIHQIDETPAGRIGVESSSLVATPAGDFELAVVPRRSGSPVVLAVGSISQTPDAGAELRAFEFEGDELVLKGRVDLQVRSMFTGAHVEPRFPLPLGSEGLLTMSGEYGGRLNLVDRPGPEMQIVPLDLYLQSEVPLRWHGRVFLSGMGFPSDAGSSRVARMRTFRNPVYATHSLCVYEVDSVSKQGTLLGVAGPFGDHAEGNLDSVVNDDGQIHMLAIEVLMGNDNSSRVHHIVFDTAAQRWDSDEVLQVRDHFTSVGRPRLVAGAAGVQAYWSYTGGANRFEDDGLYAYVVGDGFITRLSSTPGEFTILPGTSAGDDTLVALAPESPDGYPSALEWFVHRAGRWRKLGGTALPADTYIGLLHGSDPFALWREGEWIRAAFSHKGGLLVQSLRWASSR